MKNNSTGAAWFALALSFANIVHGIYNTINARRIVLSYALKRCHLGVDPDRESHDTEFDGDACVRGLAVSVTNQGQRPVTIRGAKCLYNGIRPKGEPFEGSGAGSNSMKIGPGEVVEVGIKLGGKYTIERIRSIEVRDSTDKSWTVDKKTIASLNAQGPWKPA